MLSNLPPGCTDKMIEDQCGEECMSCVGTGFIPTLIGGVRGKFACPHCHGTGSEPDAEKPTRDEMREYFHHEEGR